MMQVTVDEQFVSDYCKKFTNAVLSSIPDEKSAISGKDILTLTPSKQVNFFILKNLYSKWQEEMKKLESPYFNYKDTAVRKALVNYMNTLSQHIEVKPENLRDLIEMAVSETLFWVLSPSESLKIELDQSGIREVKSESLKSLLKYYKVFSDDLKGHLASSEGESISQFLERWGELIASKDISEEQEKEMNSLSTVKEISFSDFMEKKLEDKDIESFVEEDPSVRDGETQEQEPEEELEKEEEEKNEIIVEEESPASEREVSEPEDKSNLDEDPDVDSDIEAETNEGFPEEQEDGHRESEDGEVSEEEDSMLNEQFTQPQKTINDQFKQEEDEEVSVATTHEQKKVETILEAISVNHQYMFTSELFGGDKDAFIESIQKIEKSTSFDNAVEMLVQNYSSTYSWDMNSDEVKELLKVVFRKFR